MLTKRNGHKKQFGFVCTLLEALASYYDPAHFVKATPG